MFSILLANGLCGKSHGRWCTLVHFMESAVNWNCTEYSTKVLPSYKRRKASSSLLSTAERQSRAYVKRPLICANEEPKYL